MSNAVEPDASLPGQELVTAGLDDLRLGLVTEPALLVLVAAPRLRRLGLFVPACDSDVPWEHLLYGLIEERLGVGAHSHYNSLIRRIVSYERARERERGRGVGS